MEKDINPLLLRLSNGDMCALEELYNMLSTRILNYAITITRNKETAEDITHDVFLQINKQAQRIIKSPNPVSYIMVMTRNHSYNTLKRNNRTAFSLDNLFDVGDNSSQFENVLFKDAFSKLPANQRETVWLHLIYGLTLKDIAKIQNTPLVTVKWRYRKAITQLKTYFSQDIKEGNNYEQYARID